MVFTLYAEMAPHADVGGRLVPADLGAGLPLDRDRLAVLAERAGVVVGLELEVLPVRLRAALLGLRDPGDSGQVPHAGRALEQGGLGRHPVTLLVGLVRPLIELDRVLLVVLFVPGRALLARWHAALLAHLLGGH